MNPIEKQRSEIEKKLSQMEQKFSKDARAAELRSDARDPPRRHRDYALDENKVYGHPIVLSKTMEVKGKQRGAPGEIARLRKNYVPDEGHSYAHEVLAELRDLPKNTPAREEGKEGKIK